MLTPARCQKKVLCLLVALLLVSPRALFSQAEKPPGIWFLRDSERASVAKISKALTQPTSMAFQETALSEAVEFLKDFHKIEIQLDAKALEDAGIESDTPVTRIIKDITLRSALKLMLRDLDLTFIIKDEVLQITTPEEAEGFLVTRVYNVRSLVLSRNKYGESFYDQDTLAAIIPLVVEPTTWYDVGGIGSISSFQGMLVISQTQDVHEQVTYMLKSLRILRARTRKANHQDFSPVVIYPYGEAQRIAAARIHRALGGNTSIAFNETPLGDAVEFLKDFHKIEIQLDMKVLGDAGIESDTPVTRNVIGVSLRSGLKLMLRDLDLTFITKNEVLLITTPEEAENHLQVRTYPVGDLFKSDNEEADLFGYDVHSAGLANYGPLLWLINSTITPTTWTDVGGVGSIAAFPMTKCLVVSQTQDVHEEISDLLARLRKIHKDTGKPLAEARKTDEDRLTLTIYRLRIEKVVKARYEQPTAGSTPAAVTGLGARSDSMCWASANSPAPGPLAASAPLIPPKDLVEIITAQVAPARWKNKDTYIRGVPGKLIIRQKNSVHKKIHKLLIELEAVDPPVNRNWRGVLFKGYARSIGLF